MPFYFSSCAIPEVLVIETQVIADDRGFFMETYKQSEFAAHGIGGPFNQCNQSKSAHGTLRGLHYQKNPKAQAKLVRALRGEVYDVAVDLRRGAPTYGKWVGVTLSEKNKKALYVPTGFAHGFCVISEEAEVFYSTNNEYSPEYEAGVLWSDPELAIAWPITEPRLSTRDRTWPPLRKADNNFVYQA
jgi:dTDP-4-dehydrorhamnose 3,5-epimerase